MRFPLHMRLLPLHPLNLKTSVPNPTRPPFCLQPSDVEKAGEHVGFPSVIKPVSGAASIGVIRVNNLVDLKAAYTRCGGKAYTF